jgi:hypothetical protein
MLMVTGTRTGQLVCRFVVAGRPGLPAVLNRLFLRFNRRISCAGFFRAAAILPPITTLACPKSVWS